MLNVECVTVLNCTVPDRPLVRDPIKTLLEYPYELGGSLGL
jgi:hypothetical protein